MKVLILLCVCYTATQAATGLNRVMTNARMSSDIREVSGIDGPRRKRDVCGVDSLLTEAEKTEALEAHNKLRAQENAANEIKLEWSEALASRAQEWADTCTWEHGMTTDCEDYTVGQNLFMSSSTGASFPAVSMTSAIDEWYDEKADYHRDSATCDDGKVCGHYTQVVWAETTTVGCGIARCPTVDIPGATTWNNAVLLVCNYNPPGNYIGQAIYKEGEPCSMCADAVEQGYKCTDNLCHPCVPSQDPTCTCEEAVCANGGVWSAGDCSCLCQEGFFGKTCDSACEDLYVDVCPTWSAFCEQEAYDAFMDSTCPKTCGRCGRRR